MKFKKHDKILYDSGFGYNVGEFVRFTENDLDLYPTCTVKIPVINSMQNVSVDVYSIEKYSEEKESRLKLKYNL